jgi:glycosyltransferase involved in cell wall biosynthesis
MAAAFPAHAELPLVTIVTPVLNGARFLRENLESVRTQDYPHLEHVVVDGGSSDGSLEILAAAPGVRWTTGKDAGMYDAINAGLRLARGTIVAYQNADDRYLPGAVSAAVRVFLEHPEVDVVYGDFQCVDEDGRPLGRPRKSPPFDPRALRRWNYLPPHSTFLRTRLVTDEGHWLDPVLQYPGDWDWYLGLAEAGKRFEHVAAVLSEFRLHGGSKTRSLGFGPKLKDWRRVCEKHDLSLPLLLFYGSLWFPLRRRLGLL